MLRTVEGKGREERVERVEGVEGVEGAGKRLDKSGGRGDGKWKGVADGGGGGSEGRVWTEEAKGGTKQSFPLGASGTT